MIPGHCFGLAISPGSDSTAALGNTSNAIVQVSDPGGRGTGTLIQMMPYNGGENLDFLTADHVVRDASGGGASLFAPSQISVTLNGIPYASEDVATDFNIPQDGSSAVDLAILDVFIPGSQLNLLPAGLAPVALTNAQPAANTPITQAGYGHQATVVNVSGTLAYAYSTVNGYGAPYGTLKAGPNTINAAGVIPITGAVSDYAGIRYSYQGFQNGARINGASPNFNGSTSYIFAGDSGGPSLSGNTILGVHSSSVTDEFVNDPNSEIAYDNGAAPGYLWSDVSVFDNLAWINSELAIISIPEPSIAGLLTLGLLGIIRRRTSKGRK
jgi:hypothetical protein